MDIFNDKHWQTGTYTIDETLNQMREKLIEQSKQIAAQQATIEKLERDVKRLEQRVYTCEGHNILY